MPFFGTRPIKHEGLYQSMTRAVNEFLVLNLRDSHRVLQTFAVRVQPRGGLTGLFLSGVALSSHRLVKARCVPKPSQDLMRMTTFRQDKDLAWHRNGGPENSMHPCVIFHPGKRPRLRTGERRRESNS